MFKIISLVLRANESRFVQQFVIIADFNSTRIATDKTQKQEVQTIK